MHYRFYTREDAEETAKWVADRIPGCERGWERFVALSVGSPRIAGVIYHNYCPESQVIEMSAAADNSRWLTREVLYAMHAYPFQDAGCQMVVLRTSVKNTRMRSIAKRYGYKEFVIPRLRGRHENEAILTLTDDVWNSSRFHNG